MIEAVLKAGLISDVALAEMKRFGAPIDPDAKTEEPKDLDTAATIIAMAIESEGYVVVRETDLEVFRRYIETSRQGMLHLEIASDLEPSGVTSTDIPINYGRTKMGEYIIAWRSESIEDLLTDGHCYLAAEEKHIFFQSVRELFFDDVKAFMVCTVSTREDLPPVTSPEVA